MTSRLLSRVTGALRLEVTFPLRAGLLEGEQLRARGLRTTEHHGGVELGVVVLDRLKECAGRTRVEDVGKAAASPAVERARLMKNLSVNCRKQ